MQWRETVNCGCKINLRLKVTARRNDGLHDLSSCFLFLEDPGDLLTVEESDTGLSVATPGFPELSGKNNLLWQAAERFAACAGIKAAWRITLDKRLPVAAGLGGGSADAGGLLLLLNERYRALDGDKLREVAFSLGADVPFFLHRRPAWITGAGENVELLPELPELPQILIVNPGFPTSAKWAYTHMDKKLISADAPGMKEDLLAGKVSNWRSFCCNDLAPALFDKFPVLKELESLLYSTGALAVQISGSGSSLFALFEKGRELPVTTLQKKFAGWHGFRIFAGGKEF